MSRRNSKTYKKEEKLAETLDKLSQFEEFSQKILPMIQKDIANGLDAAGILKKYSNFAAGRLVSDLVRADAVGSNSAKQIIEQTEGKPSQKIETTHRFSDMTDEQIDAVIKSKIKVTDDKTKH